MNKRRKLIVALGAVTLATLLASFAQTKPAKVHRIGVLHGGYQAATANLHEAFRQGLRER